MDPNKQRVGNSPHSITKFRETAGDGRSFDKRKDVVEAPESKGAAKQARDAQQETLDNAEKARPQRTGNAPHTQEYAGSGQCESKGSRVGNVPHTNQSIDSAPGRHTVGGKVQKTSKERFSTRANGQQN